MDTLLQLFSLLQQFNSLKPWCRDAEVLSVFAAIISKLREAMAAEVPRIFEAVFECTLQMITKNFEVLSAAAACAHQASAGRHVPSLLLYFAKLKIMVQTPVEGPLNA